MVCPMCDPDGNPCDRCKCSDDDIEIPEEKE